STPWREGQGWTLDEALAHAPAPGDWALRPGQVEHVFTHFRLLLHVAVAETANPPAGIWARPAELDDHALPTVMRKVAA
ncbi:NUDIX domain-containing protein, partial [Acinetobacter baumannii]